MKKIKHFGLLLLVAITMFGCSEYDDSELRNDISDLKSRVEKLEEWSQTANSQISALQGLVTALNANDYVTGVSPILEGSKEVGYTITFAKSGAITIMNGKDGIDGITPVIGAKQDTDNVYYWTVQLGNTPATWMLDADGKKIATGGAGSGNSPELSVSTDTDGKVYWKLNGEWLLNNGKKVQATGDKGDKGDTGSAGSSGAQGPAGNSVFADNGVDITTDPTKVTFTLAGGDTFSVPRSSEIVIFKSFAEFKVNELKKALTLDLNIKEGNYSAIKAELTSSKGMKTAIVKATTRTATTPWDVTLTAPTFKGDGTIENNAIVTFTLPSDITEGEFALLKVTVISNGQEHAATRVVVFEENFIEIGNLKWAKGNLVADAATGSATIGAPTDGGLFFQFGSLIGWSGSANTDGTGTGDNNVALSAVVAPTEYVETVWDASWIGASNPSANPDLNDATAGTGDPCRYYLKGTWRLPTQGELGALFPGYSDNWTWTDSYASHTSGLILPVSGVRDYTNGSLSSVGDAYYWSASIKNAGYSGFVLRFRSDAVAPSSTVSNLASGLTVRCVKE